MCKIKRDAGNSDEWMKQMTRGLAKHLCVHLRRRCSSAAVRWKHVTSEYTLTRKGKEEGREGWWNRHFGKIANRSVGRMPGNGIAPYQWWRHRQYGHTRKCNDVIDQRMVTSNQSQSKNQENFIPVQNKKKRKEKNIIDFQNS